MDTARFDAFDLAADNAPMPVALTCPRRVVVADPDPEVRALVAATLEEDGWLATEVADADALAQTLLSGGQWAMYDLVVTAQRMPGGDGLQVLSTLFDAGLGVPYILLADGPDAEVADRARRTGAIAVLGRPFSPWLLRARARDIVDAAEAA